LARLLFLDESGQDQNQSPFEVLAGVSIEDKQLWPLIQAIQELEMEHFGQRYADLHREMKAKKLLKRKTFRHAAQMDPIDPEARTGLARGCLADGPSASREEITALAQAKIAFCLSVPRATREAGGAVLAAMIPKLVAYTIAWAVRLTGQEEPGRPELAEMARLTLDLRYDTLRDLPRHPRFRIFGIARINDLRPLNEQDLA
jgi:hypothetical protein